MKPNILLLFPDQWRADWIGGISEDNPLRTPALNRLSRRGVRFSRAYSSSPLCAPARACLATGRRYHRAGVRDNGDNLPLDLPTFYRQLRDSGYQVLGCGKFDLHKPGFIWGSDGRNLVKEWGFSDGIDSEGKIDGIAAYRTDSRGPYLSTLEELGLAGTYADEMEDRGTRGTSTTFLDQELYGDDWVTGNAVKLLSNTESDKPWFLQVNFPGPHLPFDITKEMASWYKGVEFPEPRNNPDKTVDHSGIRRNYAAMMENIDRQISKLEDFLRARGDWDNTLIIFASDHGEMLGDREHYGKCLPYKASVEIPLMIAGPGVEGGRINGSPVELSDLSATILNAAGSPQPEGMDSLSLGTVLTGETESIRDVAVSALSAEDHSGAAWRMAADRSYKLIEWEDGRVALFSSDDLFETEDLSGKRQGTVEYLRAELPPWYAGYEFEKDKKNDRKEHQ